MKKLAFALAVGTAALMGSAAQAADHGAKKHGVTQPTSMSTDFSAQRRYWRRYGYGPRWRHGYRPGWYGGYRPYGYYGGGPYYGYGGPGITFSFGGGRWY